MKLVQFDRECWYQLRALQTAFSKKIILVIKFSSELNHQSDNLELLQIYSSYDRWNKEAKKITDKIKNTCESENYYCAEIQSKGEKCLEMFDKLFEKLDTYVEKNNLSGRFKEFAGGEYCLCKHDEIWEPFQTFF